MGCPTTIPFSITTANNGVSVIWNSTYGIARWNEYSSTVVGPERGHYTGIRVVVTVECTGQNVTINQAELDGSGAWDVVNGSGSGQTVTAGAGPVTFNWMPGTPDHQVYITNGATGPTTLRVTGYITFDRESGA